MQIFFLLSCLEVIGNTTFKIHLTIFTSKAKAQGESQLFARSKMSVNPARFPARVLIVKTAFH
jgi:hypothetical protein